MGWWTQDEEGHSFSFALDKEMFWGDSVADIMDSALADIDDEFLKRYGRKATKAELQAGLLFSFGGEERP